MMLLPTMMVLGIDYAKNSFNAYFAYSAQVHAYDLFKESSRSTRGVVPWNVCLSLGLRFLWPATSGGGIRDKNHKPFVLPLR
jgi:hypothetical protein